MNQQQRLLTLFLPFLLLQSCVSTDTLTSDQILADGDLLVSEGELFALGFFSPGNSSYRYLGIWYYKIPELTVVWVANRHTPISGTSAILSLLSGNPDVSGANSTNYWGTNVSDSGSNIARLLDSGNFVVYSDYTRRNILWQSFDRPTHTALPGMKLALDPDPYNLRWFLTSWKSRDDPDTGNCSFRYDPHGYTELLLWKGPARWWRTGPWNGLRWSGAPEMTDNFIFNTTTSVRIYGSALSRLVLDESGSLQWLTWNQTEGQWNEFWSAPNDRCDYYGTCGANSNCNPYKADIHDFECTCLPGYEPKSPSDWNLRDGSDGCVRKRRTTTCEKGEGFVKVERVKVPDTSTAVVNRRLNLTACQEECLRNCSCTAYTSANINGGESGCLSWYGDLMDIREFSDVGQDLYIRADAVELAQQAKRRSKGLLRRRGMLAILITSIAVILFLVASSTCWLVIMRKRKGKEGRSNVLINVAINSTSFKGSPREMGLDEDRTDKNLHLFELRTIVAATDNFSSANKLGQGGFGPVYKGCLVNGQEIAVKRLSKNSGQGIEEFKNEVRVIAKLQHKNLVRLLGCCIHKEEQMLIYEYLPNKSLDYFIFDKTRTTLDWRKRFEIIFGIARGVLYLHEDSRLKIIHRDLKASNVLLDAAMNPKISDFGLARIFGVDQIEASTNRVVGTYGYMAPEYAMEGLYSIKSDVFSFGVLLLEIISGRKNTGYNLDSPALNLIGHMWDLWREEKALDIVDSSLAQPYPSHEVLRCIQIGLLCVQECAADRPTMLGVILMLGNETPLLSPKQPAFIFKRQDPSKAEAIACSVNEVTLTSVNGR